MKNKATVNNEQNNTIKQKTAKTKLTQTIGE